MKIDAVLMGDIATAGAQAQDAEAAGYDGLFAPEAPHDAFLPLAVAADRTERLELGTSIAIAFARNPLSLAHLGYDLQLLSRGRFVLGLGSQIKPHITKRFSMPWSKPAARMREMVLAIRAIWAAWHEGAPLDFRGEFYTHTLMTPVFNPGENPYGLPRVWVAGVGDAMTEVVGEVADGLICHPLTTPRYLREASLPALERGATQAGRAAGDLELAGMVIVATGEDEAELAQAVAAARMQIAFYSSTPAYRPILDLHGLGDLQTELNAMSKQGRWFEMGQAVDDEVLHTFAVVSEPAGVAKALHERFGGLLHRVSLTMPHAPAPHVLHRTVAELHAL